MSMPRFHATIATLALLLAACAPAPVKLTTDTTQRLHNAQLRVVHFEAPDFGIFTPKQAMFGALGGAVGGAIGGAISVSEGNVLVGGNHIDDPAAYIGRTLAERLNDTYRFAAITEIPQPHLVKEDDPAYAKSVAPDSMILDVRSYAWSFIYYPTHWNKYQPLYTARARLIDARTGTVVSQQTCKITGGDSDDAPTYDELLANGGEVLKEELRKAADRCMAEMAGKILG